MKYTSFGLLLMPLLFLLRGANNNGEQSGVRVLLRDPECQYVGVGFELGISAIQV